MDNCSSANLYLIIIGIVTLVTAYYAFKQGYKHIILCLLCSCLNIYFVYRLIGSTCKSNERTLGWLLGGIYILCSLSGMYAMMESTKLVNYVKQHTQVQQNEPAPVVVESH